MLGASLTAARSGKALSDRPALEPYWGKPAVRHLREDDGNVGIIRSPVRAIVLPDKDRCAGAHQRSPHQNFHGVGLPGGNNLGTCRLSPRCCGKRSRFPRLTRGAASRHQRGIIPRPPGVPLLRCGGSTDKDSDGPASPGATAKFVRKHQRAASQIRAPLRK